MKGGDLSNSPVARILLPIDAAVDEKIRFWWTSSVGLRQDAQLFSDAYAKTCAFSVDFAIVRRMPRSLARYAHRATLERYSDALRRAGWAVPGCMHVFKDLEALHLYVRTADELGAYYDHIKERRIRLLSHRTSYFPGWLPLVGLHT